MLYIAENLRQLSFIELNKVYREYHLKNCRCSSGDPAFERRLLRSEQDLYTYLCDCFFRTKGARYFIWKLDGRYVSALRAEPYLEGCIISALETVPEERKKGYAGALLTAAVEYLHSHGTEAIYSHINKKNTASIRTHVSAGFQKIYDYARFLDGSADASYNTFCRRAR